MLPRLAARASLTPRALLSRQIVPVARCLPARSTFAALDRSFQQTSRLYAASATASKVVEDAEADFFSETSSTNRSSRAEVAETFFDAPSTSSAPSSAPVPTTPSLTSALADPKRGLPEDAALFESLKGKIHHNTIKALTFKPFQLVAMSEVQKRVLALMPGLAGGTVRGSDYGQATEAQQTADIKKDEDWAAKWAARKDLLVKAKTGTGKTIAFLVPAIDARYNQLDRLYKEAPEHAPPKLSRFDGSIGGQFLRNVVKQRVGTLIISPTRELATQIANEALKVCTWHKEFNVHLLVGGESRMGQLKQWQKGRKDIVVATPGRLEDLLSEPIVASAMQYTDTLILDEADTLLEMGFKKSLQNIIDKLPEDRQTFLFSATVSPQIADIARESLRPDHVMIDCVPKNESNTHAHIPQYYTVVKPEEQLAHVLRLIAEDQLSKPDSKVILFLPTTKATMLYATLIRELKHLLPKRMEVREIHSGLGQQQRTRASDRFRADARPSILVTSDVSARGVDYPNVSRVIQVGVPSSAEQYVHRVGRTGRGGRTGGRGDLVLLPWESGFLKQMSKIDIKEHAAELASSEITSAATAAGDSVYAAKAAEIGNAVQEFLPTLDPEAIDEVFSSMLGYYAGRQVDINCYGDTLIQGLQDWAVKGGGMTQAPYVSASLRTKLGLNRKPSYGSNGMDAAFNFSKKRPGRTFGNDRNSVGQKWRTMRSGRGMPRRDGDDSDRPRRSFGGDRSAGDSDRPRRSFGDDRGGARRW